MKKILMSAFLCFALGQIQTFAQVSGEKISYEVVQEIPLADFLTAIQGQTKLKIVFNAQDLKDITIKPVDFKNQSMDDIADYLSINLPVNVELNPKEMVVSNLFGIGNNVALDDLVVTALGIKREEKALSYNVQKVDNEELTRVKGANFVNALNGRVAGVNVNQSSSGMGSAAKVVMRGAKSIEKSNNALYVIDGVPMFSLTTKQGEGRFKSTGSTESAADINPDDIESVTILNGASASALYGSAAANGVILITTKKGKEGALSVSLSSSTKFSEPFILPKFQNRYGNDGKISSWGSPLPDDYARYNPKDFFNTPYTFINSLSVSGGTQKNQSYFSASSTNTQGLIPNNKYNRYNFGFRNTSQFLNERLSLDFSANYVLQDHRNMVNQGEYMNPLVGAYLMPRGYTLERARTFEKYNPTRKIYEQVWGDFTGNDGLFNGSFSGDYTLQNPYWAAYRNVRDTHRERNYLTLSASYDLMQWSKNEKWNISARVKTDNTHYKETDKRYTSTLSIMDMSRNGFFALSKGVERQNYADVLSSFTKNYLSDALGKISVNINAGASIQDTRKDGSFIGGPLRENGIPNVFNIANIEQGAKKTKPEEEGWSEQTQSVFGSLELGFRDYLYLTLTGRNDWASQLYNSSQSSFFYPSVGLSGVITEMISKDLKDKIRPVLSFLKVRAAYSSVGSPFDRWLTTPTYEFNQDTKTWESVSYFPIGTLYPERTDSYEVGLSSKWANRNLSLDLTYYVADTKNQTIRSSISASTGYNAVFLQTGKVRNEGIELGAGYDLKFSDNTGWNTYFTLGYNKNEIKSLLEDYVNPVTGERESKDYLVKNSFGPLKYILKTGGSLGDIYTDADFRRDQDGNIFVDNNGNISTENFANGYFEKIGSILPDYTLGWRNDFKFNNLSLGFMLSGRVGGVVVSMTEAALDHYGVSERTAIAREHGGVNINGINIEAKKYYETLGKGRLPQYYTYSATNFRLQEAYISYKLPKKAINNIADITLSVIGNNLFMIYSKAPFDPEAISSTGNYAQGLDYFMMPSLRSIGLSLKANF